ncbi:MAG TPA: hypothetical protein VGX96_11430 [Candidatus Elarobacter sp.]|jgi:hypothetical protein|nr:hypothetical protein [Candidatus Elarobacter sp.]
MFAAVAATLFAVPAASAAQNSLSGVWRGFVQMNGMQCRFDLVMTPSGTYTETDRCGPYATGQSGTYRVFPNGTLSREVTDWMPKSRYIVGAQVGTGHYEPNAKPPGGTFRYTFTSPNTMIWRDVNFGGSITFHRVR